MNSAESITTTPHHAPVQPIGSAGEALAHESAVLHVTGSASYIDDLPELRRTLHAAIGLATAAHARVLSINLDRKSVV